MAMLGDSALVDTSILMRIVRPTDPAHGRALGAVARLESAGCELVVATQNLIEFWAVATRPERDNGLEYAPAVVKVQAERFAARFRILADPFNAYVRWLDLVDRYGVSGKPTHDAHLVATALANGVTRVLTFNAAHFERFSEITVETP